jgi:hypothetical protein
MEEVDRRNLPNHEQTSTDTSIATPETKLLGDLDQSAGGSLSRQTLCLVDLAQHGISRLGDDSCGETGNKTRAKVDGGLHSVREGGFVDSLIDRFGDLLIHDELGHGVWDPSRYVS